MEDLEKQSLTHHLTELRSCLIYSAIAVSVGFALSYGFIKEIGVWFFKPLVDVLPEQSHLIFTSYQEGFFSSKAGACQRRCPGQPRHHFSDLAVCGSRPF